MCVLLNITQQYTFGKIIGRGTFAKVHLAQDKFTNRSVAIKTICKKGLLENDRKLFTMYNEVSILRRASHPNIIRLFEVYENELYVHLVMEYLEGGELLQRLQSKGLYSEKDASVVIRSVLEALEYCHAKSIMHRDLKPENLILL